MNLFTLVTVTISIETRWAVGGVPNTKDAVQLPLLRDPRETWEGGILPVVPGTSLAGSLRRHLKPEAANEWLGRPPGGREVRTGTLEPMPGKLRILGAVVSNDVTVSQRGSTSVNSERGAAQGRSLRTEQWASPGTIEIHAEHPGGHDEALSEAIRSWRPLIGRGRTTGLGRGVVKELRTLTLDLDDDAHLTWWLSRRHEWFTGGTGPAGVQPCRIPGFEGAEWHDNKLLALSVAWTVFEEVHIGVDEPQQARDGRQTAMAMKEGSRYLIPGSSWKGVFRHRVEFILQHCGANNEQTEMVTNRLFGALGMSGCLSFGDSFVDESVKPITRTHAPVDRFTGGAVNGGLHRMEAIPPGSELQLDIHADAPLPDPLLGLLRHVVRDLDDGLVRVGRSGSRGYGWLKAKVIVPAYEVTPVSIEDILAAMQGWHAGNNSAMNGEATV